MGQEQNNKDVITWIQGTLKKVYAYLKSVE